MHYLGTMARNPVDWEAVYRRAYPTVYRALAATFFDGQLAEDALHDAFLEALRKPPATEGNVEGWLFRVAFRAAARAGTRQRRAVPLMGGASASLAGLDAVLDRLAVVELLRLLTERQRAIVVAHFFLDQSQDDIAQLFGIRRGTVGATISQAVARMRKEAIRVG